MWSETAQPRETALAVKLVALYKTPENLGAFLSHYEQVHLPLVRAIPNLERVTVSRVINSLMGEGPFVLMAEMVFPDKERFDEALRSAQNKAAGDDLRAFAQGLVTLMVVEEQGLASGAS